MKNIRVFLSENFQFLDVKFSIYLNRRVYSSVLSRKCLTVSRLKYRVTALILVNFVCDLSNNVRKHTN